MSVFIGKIDDVHAETWDCLTYIHTEPDSKSLNV